MRIWRAVDVSVGHDHDLVIAQFLDVEIVAADAGAHRLDERADFLRRQHPVETRAFDVEDFALQWQNRLIMPVAALFGRTACGVTFDQEKFGLGGVFFLTIGEFAGQRGNAHHRFAAGFTCLACGFTRGGGIDDFLDDGLGVRRDFPQASRSSGRPSGFRAAAALRRKPICPWSAKRISDRAV